MDARAKVGRFSALWFAVSLFLVPATLLAQTPADAPLTPAQTQAAIQNAHDAWARTIKALNIAEIGESLTNRSAGIIAIFAVSSVADHIMYSGPDVPSDVEGRARQRAFTHELNTLMLRYGLTPALKYGDPEYSVRTLPPALPTTLPLLLETQGHQFLRDLDALNRRVRPWDKNYDEAGNSFKRSFNTFGVTVLSPTCVRLDTHDPQAGVVEARLEDGKWRIDMGDWKKFVRLYQMQSKAPPKR